MSQTKTNPLLPANATPEERAISLAACFGAELLPEDIKKLWQPYEVPAKFLPFLAWAFHADFWYDDLPEANKRTLVADSWNWHRHKGTPYAIRRALEVLGYEYVTIDEWFTLKSQPHTFQVEVAPMNEDLIRKAERCIKEYKPARSHLTGIVSKTITLEVAAADENLNAAISTEVNETYPWLGAFYNSIHRYADPTDPQALQYSDVNQCEDILNGVHHGFAEHLWAPYRYDSTYDYDGSILYSTDSVEQEIIALFREIEMREELALTEGYFNTLEVFI